MTDLEGYYPEHSSLVNPWFTDNGLKGKLTEALTMLPAIKQHVLVGRDHGISASKSLRRFTNLLAARRSGTLRTAAMMSSIPAIQLAEEDGGEEGADAPAIPADYVWQAGFKWMGDGYNTTPGTAQAATRSSRRRRSPGGHALHSRAALNPRSLAGVRRPVSRCCPAAPSPPCASPPPSARARARVRQARTHARPSSTDARLRAQVWHQRFDNATDWEALGLHDYTAFPIAPPPTTDIDAFARFD